MSTQLPQMMSWIINMKTKLHGQAYYITRAIARFTFYTIIAAAIAFTCIMVL